MSAGTSEAVWANPEKTLAVFSSRDKIPARFMEWSKDIPTRFVFFTAAGDISSWGQIEVTPRGVGLLADKGRGGVLVVAPRVIPSGDNWSRDEEEMVYDRERREWFEAWEVLDEGGCFPYWTVPEPRKAVVEGRSG